LLHTWTVESTLRGLALGGDGASAIAAYGDGSLHLWDFATGKERPIAQPMIEHLPSDGLGGLNPVVRADFSPDARSVALLGGGWLQLVDVATGRLRFKAAAPGVGGPAFAADGRSLAVVGKTTGKTLQAGSWFGSQTLASTVAWLDSTAGEKRREIEVPGADVLSLAFSPDGLHLAVGALLFDPARGNIRIYRLSDGREVQSIATPAPWITSLTFTPDGKRVVAGLSDTSIVFWDLRRGD
jgi:WD40 repeat protein